MKTYLMVTARRMMMRPTRSMAMSTPHSMYKLPFGSSGTVNRT